MVTVLPTDAMVTRNGHIHSNNGHTHPINGHNWQECSQTPTNNARPDLRTTDTRSSLKCKLVGWPHLPIPEPANLPDSICQIAKRHNFADHRPSDQTSNADSIPQRTQTHLLAEDLLTFQTH